LQTLYDLEFLRRLADLWGGEWLDICELLGEQTLRVREMVRCSFKIIFYVLS